MPNSVLSHSFRSFSGDRDKLKTFFEYKRDIDREGSGILQCLCQANTVIFYEDLDLQLCIVSLLFEIIFFWNRIFTLVTVYISLTSVSYRVFHKHKQFPDNAWLEIAYIKLKVATKVCKDQRKMIIKS